MSKDKFEDRFKELDFDFTDGADKDDPDVKVTADIIAMPTAIDCETPEDFVKTVTMMASQLDKICKLMYMSMKRDAPMLLTRTPAGLALAGVGQGLRLMTEAGNRVMKQADIKPIDVSEMMRAAARDLLDDKDLPEQVRDKLLAVLSDEATEDDWPEEFAFIPNRYGEVH